MSRSDSPDTYETIHLIDNSDPVPQVNYWVLPATHMPLVSANIAAGDIFYGYSANDSHLSLLGGLDTIHGARTTYDQVGDEFDTIAKTLYFDQWYAMTVFLVPDGYSLQEGTWGARHTVDHLQWTALVPGG
jgi:hypothetical protein